jgi:hypothetical protein
VHFGGDQPSQLLDPGEWLIVADDHARHAPASGLLSDARLARDRHALHTAIAALDEVQKFVPPGAAEIPLTPGIAR